MKVDVDAVIGAFGKNEPCEKSLLDYFRLDGRAGPVWTR